jgi:hypothetical protein
MNLIKKYGIILAIVLPVVLLVVIRSAGTGHFGNDAAKLSAPSINQSNIITTDKLSSLRGDILIISLSEPFPANMTSDYKTISIQTDSILTKKYLKIIKGNDGPVVLFSSDPALSARIWIILANMGIKNLFILNDSTDGETMKYKFQPDISAN